MPDHCSELQELLSDVKQILQAVWLAQVLQHNPEAWCITVPRLPGCICADSPPRLVQPPGVPFPSLGEGVSAPLTHPDSVKTPGHRGRCENSHVCKSHLTKPAKNNLDMLHFLIQVKLPLMLAFLAFYFLQRLI